jgi:hypothetical protein
MAHAFFSAALKLFCTLPTRSGEIKELVLPAVFLLVILKTP